LRAADIRLCASCRFTSLKSTVFTDQFIPQSVVRSKFATALDDVSEIRTDETAVESLDFGNGR